MSFNQALLDQHSERQVGQGLPPLPSLQSPSTVDKVLAAARFTGIPQLVGMTFEGLRRLDTGFRQGILTATGQVPVDEFPDHWRRAMSGELRQSTEEFNKLFWGAQVVEQAKRIPLIPGWTKEVMNPETRMLEDRPVISVGSAMNFGADLWASPLTYLTVGGGPAVNLLKKTPLWSPFAKMGSGARYLDSLITGTDSRWNLIGKLLMHVREPTRALGRHSEITEAFTATRDAMGKKLQQEWSPMLHKMFFHDEKVLGIVPRAAGKYSSLEQKRVMNQLFGLDLKDLSGPLSAREQLLSREIMTNVAEPLLRRLQAMDYVGADWSPARLMKDVLPRLVDAKAIPGDVLQSWDWKTLGLLRTPMWKDKAGALKKMEITSENLDLPTALRDFVYAAEKKLHWNARHQVTETTKRPLGPLFPDQFEEITETTWKNTGPLLKYAPTKSNVAALQNPELVRLGVNSSERSYLVRLINEIQGKGRGRFTLELGEHTQRFIDGLRELPQAKRIIAGLKRAGLPADALSAASATYSKPQYASQFFVHNVVRNMLWMNLGAAIKNTSQLLNTATVKGIPATIKGMFRLSNKEYRELAGREVMGEFKKLLIDENWWSRANDRLDNIMMRPFNVVENFARGTAFNVYLDDFMKTARIPNLDALRKSGKFDEAVRYAVNGSYETNFIYGVLGRPASVLGSPMLRPATTLLSFPFKQAEFMRQAFLNDGSAVLRSLGMHGMAIDLGNRWMGVAPETWLGWGYSPPVTSVAGVPLIQSPQVRWAMDVFQGFTAIADGRENEAAAAFRRAQSTVSGVLDMPQEFWNKFNGDTTGQTLGSPLEEAGRAAAAGLPLLGWIPFPVVAVAKTNAAVDAFMTGRKTSQSGETWVPVTRTDAIRSVFMQTTTDQARRQLNGMVRRARARVDRVLDERVRSYVRAAEGSDGQALMEAAIELMAPIRISHGLIRQPPTQFQPVPDMVDSRLKNVLKNRTQSRDLNLMEKNGFLQDIYWARYIEVMLRSEGLQ